MGGTTFAHPARNQPRGKPVGGAVQYADDADRPPRTCDEVQNRKGNDDAGSGKDFQRKLNETQKETRIQRGENCAYRKRNPEKNSADSKPNSKNSALHTARFLLRAAAPKQRLDAFCTFAPASSSDYTSSMSACNAGPEVRR